MPTVYANAPVTPGTEYWNAELVAPSDGRALVVAKFHLEKVDADSSGFDLTPILVVFGPVAGGAAALTAAAANAALGPALKAWVDIGDAPPDRWPARLILFVNGQQVLPPQQDHGFSNAKLEYAHSFDVKKGDQLYASSAWTYDKGRSRVELLTMELSVTY